MGGGERLEEGNNTPLKTPARKARRFGDPVRESGRLALFPYMWKCQNISIEAIANRRFTDEYTTPNSF